MDVFKTVINYIFYNKNVWNDTENNVKGVTCSEFQLTVQLSSLNLTVWVHSHSAVFREKALIKTHCTQTSQYKTADWQFKTSWWTSRSTEQLKSQKFPSGVGWHEKLSVKNIWRTFIRWTETWHQINDNVAP